MVSGLVQDQVIQLYELGIQLIEHLIFKDLFLIGNRAKHAAYALEGGKVQTLYRSFS